MKTDIPKFTVLFEYTAFYSSVATLILVISLLFIQCLFLIEKKREQSINCLTIIPIGENYEYSNQETIQSSPGGSASHERYHARLQNASPRGEIFESDQTFFLPELAERTQVLDYLCNRSDKK